MADLKEAYNGFSNIVDTRQKCCGAQFNNMRYYVPIGGKQVSIQQLKTILRFSIKLTKKICLRGSPETLVKFFFYRLLLKGK